MISPLVSICIPTYNGAAYLREALLSVRYQTYSNIEIVISDDGSKDATLDISRTFKKEAVFPVYIYEHQPAGIGANWDHSIEKANGEYIKFLFQDDLLEPDCIEKMMNVLKENSLEMVVCKRKIIDSHGAPLQSDWLVRFGDLQQSFGLEIDDFLTFKKNHLKKVGAEQPLHFNFIGEPVAALFTKKLYRETGAFASPLKQYLDLEYWLKVLKKHDIGILGEKLISFRVHDMQSSNTNIAKRTIDEKEYIERIFFWDFFFHMSRRVQKTLMLKNLIKSAVYLGIKNDEKS